MRQRYFYTLIGIIIVVVLAIVANVSGGPYTINIGHPWTVSPGLDLQGGARFLLQAEPAPGQKITADEMNAARDIIESRVAGGFGVSEPTVQTVTSGNKYYISVEMPGLKKDLQDVASSLQKTGYLTLVALGTTQLPRGASAKGYQVLAKGSDIIGRDVSVGTDAAGLPAVNVTLDSAAGNAVQNYTQAHVGQFMGIAIDGKIYDSPTIQEAFGSQFQITNVGSVDNATALAATLKYGALPVPLKIVSTQEVSATLGPSNVRASILAGIVGLLIVMLFMAVYYRLPGLLADAALIIYALVVFATFKVIPSYTLTLAGIAGFILSIGMAVDANILIFERTKEELRNGHSIAAAVEAGFGRAWPSIRDSNVSTIMTCCILWWFGANFATSTIVGFATTLLIGVVVSLLTAVLVSRTFLRLVLAGARPTNRALFGADV